jgi:rubrerythrin
VWGRRLHPTRQRWPVLTKFYNRLNNYYVITGGFTMKKNVCIGILCIAVAAMAVTGCKKQAGTIENLKAAITGETTASAKYAAYAQKAKEEKLGKIAILFEAASKAESVHVKMHTAVLDAMGVKMDPITPQFTVKTTKENLEDAIKGESYEIGKMYPEFIKKANEEAKKDAAASFDRAFQVEKKHNDLYKSALDALNKKDVKSLPDAYAVCMVCGNTFGANVPAICDICGEPKKDFAIIKY